MGSSSSKMGPIKKVAIFGAGTMGCGIAIAIAQSGMKVIVKSRDNAQKIFQGVRIRLEKYIEKGEVSLEESNSIISNIYSATDIEVIFDVDIVIETIVEDLAEKRKLFKQLSKHCKSNTIIATNTSSISIEELALAIEHANRFIGLHFFNPADRMKLVEIVKSRYTSNMVVQKIKFFLKNIGKDFIVIYDTPGFVVNRLLFSMINDGAYMLMEGVAKKEEIDKAMCLGANHPLGPFALADLVGIDVCFNIIKRLNSHKITKEPCPLFIRMIKEGKLGKKRGEGFYKYI